MQVRNLARGSSLTSSIAALARNHLGSLRNLFLILFLAIAGSMIVAGSNLAYAQGPVTYYVDCSQGNDLNDGTSSSKAWKSMAKANKAALKPGDKLLFKRGCAWQGPLKASWNGTAAQPILIAAYGSGDLPKIQDGYSSNVAITGSYQIIEYIEVLLSTPPNPSSICNNQPVGWKLGFAFGGSSSYNTVQHSKAHKLAVGIYFGGSNHHNKALNNTVVDNNVVWELTSIGSSGPAGIILYGDHNEIAHNYFTNNTRNCLLSGKGGGISIELYSARNSNIHHNRSYNDRVFVELGSSKSSIAADNTFAYNLHVVKTTDSITGPRFVVTRGQGHVFGPVWRTKVYNNTVYYTAGDSKGVSCENCGFDVLTVKNNIFWVDQQPITSDGPFIEEHNILWSTDGKPKLGFTKSLSTKIVNPGFKNAGADDFRLVASSPAREAGTHESLTLGYVVDLDLQGVPQVALVDAGAYEGTGAAATPAPTTTPVPPAAPTPEPSPTPSPMPGLIASCTVSINGGALYTGNAAVQVKANVPNAAQVMVATDAGFTGATWQPYQEQLTWTLPDTGGRIATLLVYARFVDASGAPLCGGAQLSDDIIFDPVPPTLSVAVSSMAAASAAGVEDNAAATVNLSILAADQENGSGVEEMQISPDEEFSDPAWQPYTPSVDVDAQSAQMLYIRVRDGSGNISEAVQVTIPAQASPANGLFLPQITR
jgi:hypothetical protein